MVDADSPRPRSTSPSQIPPKSTRTQVHHFQLWQSRADPEGMLKLMATEKAVVSPLSVEEQLAQQDHRKTELCRLFQETGSCRYGAECKFAHGPEELRPVLRHPKYKLLGYRFLPIWESVPLHPRAGESMSASATSICCCTIDSPNTLVTVAGPCPRQWGIVLSFLAIPKFSQLCLSIVEPLPHSFPLSSLKPAPVALSSLQKLHPNFGPAPLCNVTSPARAAQTLLADPTEEVNNVGACSPTASAPSPVPLAHIAEVSGAAVLSDFLLHKKTSTSPSPHPRLAPNSSPTSLAPSDYSRSALPPVALAPHRQLESSAVPVLPLGQQTPHHQERSLHLFSLTKKARTRVVLPRCFVEPGRGSVCPIADSCLDSPQQSPPSSTPFAPSISPVFVSLGPFSPFVTHNQSAACFATTDDIGIPNMLVPNPVSIAISRPNHFSSVNTAVGWPSSASTDFAASFTPPFCPTSPHAAERIPTLAAPLPTDGIWYAASAHGFDSRRSFDSDPCSNGLFDPASPGWVSTSRHRRHCDDIGDPGSGRERPAGSFVCVFADTHIIICCRQRDSASHSISIRVCARAHSSIRWEADRGRSAYAASYPCPQSDAPMSRCDSWTASCRRESDPWSASASFADSQLTRVFAPLPEGFPDAPPLATASAAVPMRSPPGLGHHRFVAPAAAQDVTNCSSLGLCLPPLDQPAPSPLCGVPKSSKLGPFSPPLPLEPSSDPSGSGTPKWQLFQKAPQQ
ncbi:hypothetical protein PAPYR_2583 [Paratrimastix pyriformis]|uniref:C3H1-type domain-containing protein n=1 Tax=Paratrimastix pyriformis TaxID=342808 RepID=A0ABQ8UPN0_9EUKA|nr:hypothetical protein PAPYR_2583 [Paratrimastix pyriformis]